VSAAGKDGAEHVSHVFSLSGTGYELRKPADTSSATLHDGGDHGYVCLSVYSDMMVADAESQPEPEEAERRNAALRPDAIEHTTIRISVKP
jgi:hypothetical protein